MISSGCYLLYLYLPCFWYYLLAHVLHHYWCFIFQIESQKLVLILLCSKWLVSFGFLGDLFWFVYGRWWNVMLFLFSGLLCSYCWVFLFLLLIIQIPLNTFSHLLHILFVSKMCLAPLYLFIGLNSLLICNQQFLIAVKWICSHLMKKFLMVYANINLLISFVLPFWFTSLFQSSEHQ